MCTALLPPGVNPIAVNKYIISYGTISHHIITTKAVRNIMSPCFCLYSETTYRNETKHKIQLTTCNLFPCLILPHSLLLVKNNDAGAERVFGTRPFEIFSLFSKSFSRGSLNFFITCEVESFIESCEQPEVIPSVGMVWSNFI
jgi:hypothetical protein